MIARSTLGPQVLYGARAIAAYLGTTQRVAYHLTTETQRLPHFHLGKTVCARREDLDARLAHLATAGSKAV